MKIAFIGGRDINKLGGIETYMSNLCTHLVKMGHEPVVYCESDNDGSEFVKGFQVFYWKSPRNVYLCKIVLGLKSTLHALFKQKNIQVFHYNAWPPALWSWIPRIYGRTTVMMGHGLEWKRTKYTLRMRKIMKMMEAISAKTNQHLIMCSNEQTKYYQEKYSVRCVTVPTAINMPNNEFIKRDILYKYSLRKGKYFLYLGRLVQDKNPDYLISAFIESNIKDWKLVIAGSNDAHPEYVQKLKNMAGENENIVFTGAVYGLDKECLLHDCAVFCIPSTVEGLAITLLEAMSYGKPVIASDIEANKEGLGDNGIWVEAENVEALCIALLHSKENIEELKKLGVYNVERVDKYYRWSSITEKYVDYLYDIVK